MQRITFREQVTACCTWGPLPVKKKLGHKPVQSVARRLLQDLLPRLRRSLLRVVYFSTAPSPLNFSTGVYTQECRWLTS